MIPYNLGHAVYPVSCNAKPKQAQIEPQYSPSQRSRMTSTHLGLIGISIATPRTLSIQPYILVWAASKTHCSIHTWTRPQKSQKSQKWGKNRPCETIAGSSVRVYKIRDIRDIEYTTHNPNYSTCHLKSAICLVSLAYDWCSIISAIRQ
jgi:hypothetical protein